jgi:DNA-binding NarL/FixJ family response regulator
MRILRHSRGMKILVVGDHPVLREGLFALLYQEGPQTVAQKPIKRP